MVYATIACVILVLVGVAIWWANRVALVAQSEGNKQVADQATAKVTALESALSAGRKKEHEQDVAEAGKIPAGDVGRAIGFLVGSVRPNSPGPGGNSSPGV